MYKILDPYKILSPSRLDIIVKVLYVTAHLNGDDDTFTQLYLKHIKYRTLGFEDNKNSTNSFLLSFKKLIKSIHENGFDPSKPIPLSSNNEILNGAHRLACCLYFKTPVNYYIDTTKRVYTWDYNWFDKLPFKTAEKRIILKKYIELSTRKISLILVHGDFKKIKSELIKTRIVQTSSLIGWQIFDFHPTVYEMIDQEIEFFDTLNAVDLSKMKGKKVNVFFVETLGLNSKLIDSDGYTFKDNTVLITQHDLAVFLATEYLLNSYKISNIQQLSLTSILKVKKLALSLAQLLETEKSTIGVLTQQTKDNDPLPLISLSEEDNQPDIIHYLKNQGYNFHEVPEQFLANNGAKVNAISNPTFYNLFSIPCSSNPNAVCQFEDHQLNKVYLQSELYYGPSNEYMLYKKLCAMYLGLKTGFIHFLRYIKKTLKDKN